MQSITLEAMVGPEGSLHLRDLPFPEGQTIEVALSAGPKAGGRPGPQRWTPGSLDEIAAAQGVRPVEDLDSLRGTWPEDDLDDFLAAREAWQREDIEADRPDRG